jgi:hypothetical protein
MGQRVDVMPPSMTIAAPVVVARGVAGQVERGADDLVWATAPLGGSACGVSFSKASWSHAVLMSVSNDRANDRADRTGPKARAMPSASVFRPTFAAE